MHQLKYLDEIKPMDEISELSHTASSSHQQQQQAKVDNRELSLGKILVENLTSEEFDPSQYSDTYTKELEKLIEAKSKGKEVREISKGRGEGEGTKDLLEALKASLKTTTTTTKTSSKRTTK
jgi:DNA end-binding protein Ku